MTDPDNSTGSCVRFQQNIPAALAAWPCIEGADVTIQAPAVADVMCGLGEETGSLVLTATLGLSFVVSIWKIAGQDLRIRFMPEVAGGPAYEFSMPLAKLGVSPEDAPALIDACRAAQSGWAAPICLTLNRAIAGGALPCPQKGLAVLVQTDFPPDVDWGRPTILAAAVVEALSRVEGRAIDRLEKCRICSEAISPLTGMYSLRTALTTLTGPADGSLLQVSFHPQPVAEPLSLPAGVIVLAARTTLSRPVTRERLVETRLCAEMGQRVIQDWQGRGDRAGGPKIDRLSAITTNDFVERYRDILPQKITGKAFVAKFGAIRGLNGEVGGDETYKIRSRAEHHIYETRRVHEFSNFISRARRTNALDALTEAGERMYGSHWSHSQRCGIGGVETDLLVKFIKEQGPAAGLFGAKITASGNGGEMVVLMRDDAAAHAALASAIARAQAHSARTIHTYRGHLPGAELRQMQTAGA